MTFTVDITPSIDHPVALTARLDPGLSRWTWLVEWFLAVPTIVGAAS